MPDERTVRTWALENDAFSPQYTRAREIGYHGLFDQMLEIADTPRVGVKTVIKPTGIETTEGDMIEHRRLQIDARKWMLAKALPKIYGDRVTAEISGKDGGPIEVSDPASVAQRMAFLLNSGVQALEEKSPSDLH